MKKILSLIVLICISTQVFAQDDQAYAKAVKKCITSNGTISYYEEVLDDMYKMLAVQFESKNVPESVWVEIKKGKQLAMDDLAGMIVLAYKAHFAYADVKKMNALYSTKAGKNMFKKEALSEGDKLILNEFYESETGQKIMGSQESMNAAMSKISQTWSGDLYQEVIFKLASKGYNL